MFENVGGFVIHDYLLDIQYSIPFPATVHIARSLIAHVPLFP